MPSDDRFHFISPLCSHPRGYWDLEQSSHGVVGSKLYPGALVLAHYVEAQHSKDASYWRSICSGVGDRLRAGDGIVLELGSGISGFGALLFGSGILPASSYRTLATDLDGDILALLKRNMLANTIPSGSLVDASTCQRENIETLPLRWGKEAFCTAASTSEAPSDWASIRNRINLIVGADIVYHEPLIQPLLETLIALTEPIASSSTLPASSASTTSSPPPPPQSSSSSSSSIHSIDSSQRVSLMAPSPPPPMILLSYVQRFKRAKAFFKQASRWFTVEMIPHAGGDVIDYDTLTWTLPTLHRLLRHFVPDIAKACDLVPLSLSEKICSSSSCIRGESATSSTSSTAEGFADIGSASTLNSASANYTLYLRCLLALRNVRMQEAAEWLDQWRMRSRAAADGASQSQEGNTAENSFVGSSSNSSSSSSPCLLPTPAPFLGNKLLFTDDSSSSSEDEREDGGTRTSKMTPKSPSLPVSTPKSDQRLGQATPTSPLLPEGLDADVQKLTHSSWPEGTMDVAKTVSENLGLRFELPSKAYIVTLTRKEGSGSD